MQDLRLRERIRVPWPAARISTVGALTAGCYSLAAASTAKLGGRDSNPDSQDQNLMSCHWTTPQGLLEE